MRSGWIDLPDKSKSVLLDVYRRLLARYGRQHWWPGESKLEIIVGAILTQSTSWRSVERAIGNLKSASYLSLKGLRDIAEDELAVIIKPAGFFNAKARKIKAFVSHLWYYYDGDLESLLSKETAELRAELLSVHGIGEETADDIIVYAAGKPSFVTDSYTRRVVKRLGLAPNTDSYRAYQNLFHESLPHDAALYNEYHALLDEHAKTTCKPEPLCGACCLLDICPTGRERVGEL